MPHGDLGSTPTSAASSPVWREFRNPLVESKTMFTLIGLKATHRLADVVRELKSVSWKFLQGTWKLLLGLKNARQEPRYEMGKWL